MLEEGHLSRTVEDHCPQLHLSVDERFDHAGVVRSDAKMRRRQTEVEGLKPLHFLKAWLKRSIRVDENTFCP